MKVRNIKVRNFRGIKSLDWCIDGATICLIGPGDSTKSTILSAIELALSPHWNPNISDTDFYECNTTESIIIEVTVGEIPEDFKRRHDRFGDYLRGWKNSTIIDEPDDTAEHVLTVKLSVDENLEPIWELWTDSERDKRTLSARERALFGVARVGSYIDREFSWRRGSALSGITGKIESISGVFAEADRAARKAFEDVQGRFTQLQNTAQQATKVAEEYGVNRDSDIYRPGLDITSGSGAGSLALYDGEVPLKLAGLGTRRLLAIGLQREFVPDGAILLVDEVEQALEPHRLRKLLKLLRTPVTRENQQEDDGNDSPFKGQTFMTTHSTIPIVSLDASELYIVRSVNGVTSIEPVIHQTSSPKDTQPIIKLLKEVPTAFLAKKVLACEGKTEEGFCWAFDEAWEQREPKISFAYAGVITAIASSGGGSDDMPKIALRLAKLGYDVAYLGDTDRSLGVSETRLRDEGITVLLWDNKLCLEQRICLDLPLNALQDYIDLAVQVRIDEFGNEISEAKLAVLGQLKDKGNLQVQSCNFEGWNISENEVRKTLGYVSKTCGWFKDQSRGQRLGELVLRFWDAIDPDSDLRRKIALLKDWVYAY